MHARHHRWIVLTLISALTVPLGCRGTRPHDNLVQVTQDQEVAVGDLDAPRQRLAVNKPRTGGESGISETGVNRLRFRPIRVSSDSHTALSNSRAKRDGQHAARRSP